MSSIDEPEIQTEKTGARPNFLGKLWKAQAPISAHSPSSSESEDASTSETTSLPTSAPAAKPAAAASPFAALYKRSAEHASDSPVASMPAPSLAQGPVLTSPQSSSLADTVPPGQAAVVDDDPKAAPPSKFLSKLWKAQKSISPVAPHTTILGMPACDSPIANEAVGNQNTINTTDGTVGALHNSQVAFIENAESNEFDSQDYVPLREIQESLKIDEAALIGDPFGASDINEPIEPPDFEGFSENPESFQGAESGESADDAARGQPVQRRELTPEERKAQRKAGVEAYERMKEEQRLKTERGNTVRALNSLNLSSGSPSSPGQPGLDSEPGSSTDADALGGSAIAGGNNLDSLVTRQSFANTVAAAPASAPKVDRAAGTNDFVRKYPLLVVLGIAVVAAGIAYYPTETSHSNLNNAMALLANNQPQPAIEKLTRAIASNPKLVPAYVARADAYSRTGATDLALVDCSKAIKLAPDEPEAYEMRAKIELPPGHFRQVISDLETVSKIRGTLLPAAMAILGHAYMGDGQYSHALTQFSKKLDRDPDDLNAMVAKAKCYLAMNLPHKAIASCDAAIAKAGNSYDACVLRGQCEDQLNNGTAALKDFDKAISIDGQRAAAFLSRGMYLAHAGDYAKASQDMDTGIKLPGGIPDGRYKHAMVYALQKDKVNALEQFKLLEAKPDFKIDNWFYIQRSDIYAQLQDFKSAKADLEKALKSDISYQTACWLRLARCFESEHDYKKAALFAGKVLADEPTNSTALLKHSKYSLLSGNRMTAMDDLYKAIASAPKNPQSYVSRGDLYVQDKQYSLAADDYQKAGLLAPLNSDFKKKLVACNEFIKRPRAENQSSQDKPVTLSAAALKEIAEGNLQTLKQKGYEALKSGRAEYAVAALTRAIYLNPNDGNARRYLAYALLKSGNAADAAQQFYAWENVANPDPSSSIAFAKAVAAQTDAQNLFEHLAERYRTNVPILLEIARQCAFYHYDSVEGSALDFATKVATSDEQVALNRLRISLDSALGRLGGSSQAPATVPGGKPLKTAN